MRQFELFGLSAALAATLLSREMSPLSRLGLALFKRTNYHMRMDKVDRRSSAE